MSINKREMKTMKMETMKRVRVNPRNVVKVRARKVPTRLTLLVSLVVLNTRSY